MGYVVKETGADYVPAPAGLHRAVCVDVVEMGVMQTAFGPKEKIRVVWEIEELMEDQRRFTVSQLYTPSLNEKAKLREHLESWRGRPFTPKELKGFDLDKVLGAPCQVQVQHTTRNDRTYANVIAVVPSSKGQEKLAPSGAYVRVQDRHPDASRDAQQPDDVYEDIVPF